MARTFTIIAAVLGCTGVLLGAFAAHGLEDRIHVKLLETFEVGARYQMYHAIALLGVAWASERFPHRATRAAGWCFVGGVIVFSGTLYALAITGVKWWGAVTPIGGVMLIAGWAMLAIGAARSPRDATERTS